MRPLELALWVVTAPLLLWCLSPRGVPGWARLGPAVAVALLAAHAALEGGRWHLAPLYLLAPYLFLACVWPRAPGLEPGPWGALLGIALLAATAALAAVFPVFDLPRPTGPHPVGTVTLHLVDPAREDPRTDRPDGRRELMVQLWYPAGQAGPGRAYRLPAETDFWSRHLALVRTHAAAGVPVAGEPGRYPVILFSASWDGGRADNTIQAEELASHGFVVAGVDHPYGSSVVVFPDGRRARGKLGAFLDYATDETLAATERSTEEELRTRAADLRFVLDELDRLDRADPDGRLTGRLDAARAGVFGHSFGGAVAAEVCRADPRVRAGADLDGLIFGEPRTAGFGKPFLVFFDDGRIPTAAEIARLELVARRHWTFIAENERSIRRGLAQVHGYLAVLRGGRHVSFCDKLYYTPVRRVRPANNTLLGAIPYERASEIVNAYLLSLFRRHLTGKEDGLLDSPSPYPEVQIERLPNSDH